MFRETITKKCRKFGNNTKKVFIAFLCVLTLSGVFMKSTSIIHGDNDMKIHSDTGYTFEFVFDRGGTIISYVVTPTSSVTTFGSPVMGDKLLYVIVTKNGTEETWLIEYSLIGHQGSGKPLTADGTMGPDGILTSNDGTANFWFNGLPDNSYLVVNKIWLDYYGNPLTITSPELLFDVDFEGNDGSSISFQVEPGEKILVKEGTYTITEPDIPDYTLVDVSEDTDDITCDLANRKATVVTVDPSGIYVVTFTNQYDIDPTEYLRLTGNKRVNDVTETGTTLAGKVFSFEVYDVDIDSLVATGESDDSGQIVFTEIPIFGDLYIEGEEIVTVLHLRVVEVASPYPDWVASTVEIFMTVTITTTMIDGVKNMSYDIEYYIDDQLIDTGIEFTNTHVGIRRLDDAEWAPNVIKSFEGDQFDLEDIDGAFNFVMEDENGDVVATGTYDISTGIVEFTTQTFTEENIGETHTYRIYEESGSLPGWTYDDSEHFVTIEILAGSEKVLVSVEYPGVDRDYVEFVNEYKKPPIVYIGTIWSPTVNKVVEGMSLADAEGMFEFVMEDEDGNVVATATNNSLGEVVFPDLIFEGENIGETHTYLIYETTGTLPGWSYDDSQFYVTITITADSENNVVVNVEYPERQGEMVFTNVFTPIIIYDTAVLRIIADKRVEGMSLAEAAGLFEFVMEDEDGNVVGRVTNNSSGQVIFPLLTFEEENIGETHTYKIYEVTGTLKVWTYDTSVFYVKVEVTAVEGEINLVVEYLDGPIIFTNTFEKTPPHTGDVSILPIGLLLVSSIYILLNKKKRHNRIEC